MVHKNKAPRKKKRLTPDEIEKVRQWYEESPMDRKPTIRRIAKAFGINRSGVMKSLGGWEGIQRNRPEPPPKRLFPNILEQQPASKLEQYTVNVPKDFKP